MPREFRYLSVYVAERERASNKDKVLGKVSIKKEGMHKFYGKDNWFPIMPVDADSEVQVGWKFIGTPAMSLLSLQSDQFAQSINWEKWWCKVGMTEKKR